jgi:hypothetical protein
LPTGMKQLITITNHYNLQKEVFIKNEVIVVYRVFSL